MMTELTPRDPDFEAKVRSSFRQQGIMEFLGAELTVVEPGHVEIILPYRRVLCQQHGFFHAGATTTIADSAAGYAAFSLFAPGTAVLTTEFKINLLAPADGERLRAVGRVIKPGRTLTVVEADVYVTKAEREKHCARLLSSMICIPDRAHPREQGVGLGEG